LTTHLPGMEIGHASSGSEALRLLVSEPYDLVIFELLLPEMSGIDFGAALRAADTHVPLLAITRQGGTDEWRALSKLGVHGCLLQPMDPLALAAAVCAAFMVG
ncbi:MAG: response regulator, partial [Myxococcota bacterium]